MTKGDRRWSLLAWCLVFLLFLGLEMRYARAAIDDFYIILRYVENAVMGHGFVYNIGERVEGFTCFGWIVLLVWLAKFGCPAYWTAKIAGILCCLALLWFCHRIAREFWRGSRYSRLAAFVPVLLLGTNQDFLYWAGSGLESSLFAALAMAGLYLIVVETRLAREQGTTRWLVSVLQGLLCFIATLVRPEGLVLLAFMFPAKLAMWRRKDEWLKHCAILALVAAVPLACFFLWRHDYYGSWLPNTYYAKAGGELSERVHDGKFYLLDGLAGNAFGWLGRHGETAWPAMLLFLALPAAAVLFVRKKRAHLAVFSWAFAFTAAVVWEGGDWMPHHRFLVPVLGCWMLLLSHSVLEALPRAAERLRFPPVFLVRVGAIALVTILCADFVRVNIRTAPLSPPGDGSWPVVFSRHILRHADKGTLAASDIGLLGYLTRYRVIDMAGLVDRRIAHSPGNSSRKDYDMKYVLDQAPDFIVLTGQQRSVPDGRMRKHAAFVENYQVITACEGHTLYARKNGSGN